MKFFAFFLPQFHEIPENNKWWGEGFTEWTNVKRAKPLFSKHIQPKIPLNQNYYNLLDKSTMEWQLSLQNKYKVDGLIYYHYYFKGKLLLEKPAENLLKWKDINQPFFFCWANHPWIRSWEGKSEIIMPLEYGLKEDWERHFRYLLKFFRDERYEKKENKPLFCTYSSNFKEKRAMFDYWNMRSKEEGFDGIYFIETFMGDISYEEYKKNLSRLTQKVLFREPSIQINAFNDLNKSFYKLTKKRILGKMCDLGIRKKPLMYDGTRLMKHKIQTYKSDDEIIPSIWFEWDNTSRHKERGYIISSYKKELFMHYMDKAKKEEYMFLNAWNEWAEGMMLEPTEDLAYKYLEWISEWKERNQKN